MKITISDSQIQGVLAKAEIEFNDAPGCVLEGFQIRRGDRSDWVAAPSRKYIAKDKTEKYHPLFNSYKSGDKRAWKFVETEILRAYNSWLGRKAQESDGSVFDQDADEFADDSAPF